MDLFGDDRRGRPALRAEPLLTSRWWRGGIAVLTGALPALAFPAASLWWFAYVALVPWILLVRTAATGRRAMLDGWLGGLGFMVAVHHWLLPSLHVFTVVIAALLGLLWAPWGRLVRRFLGGVPTPGRAAAALVVLPSAWLMVELVRSWEGLGGPWGLLGSSQWQLPPALRLASVGGVWLLSALVVAVNTAITLLAVAWMARGVPTARRLRRPASREGGAPGLGERKTVGAGVSGTPATARPETSVATVPKAQRTTGLRISGTAELPSPRARGAEESGAAGPEIPLASAPEASITAGPRAPQASAPEASGTHGPSAPHPTPATSGPTAPHPTPTTPGPTAAHPSPLTPAPTPLHKGPAAPALAGLVAVAVTAVAAWAWAPRPEVAGHVRVAVVQPGVIDGAGKRLEREEALTRSLAGRDLDLVVWGESSVGFDLADRPDVARRITALSRDIGADILVNVDARRSDRPGIFKSSVLVGQDGPTGDRYDKMRLVPFGEYIPARSLLGWATSVGKAAGEDRRRGDRQVVMDAGHGLRVGPLVCFESAFPDMSRQLTRDGAQLLLAQSATSSFQASWAPEQHASLAAVRAAETGRPMVHATLTGVSAVHAPDGSRLGTPLGTSASAAAVYDVPLGKGTTAYVRWGDWPVHGALVVLGALCAAEGARALRRRPVPERRGPRARTAHGSPVRPGR